MFVCFRHSFGAVQRCAQRLGELSELETAHVLVDPPPPPQALLGGKMLLGTFNTLSSRIIGLGTTAGSAFLRPTDLSVTIHRFGTAHQSKPLVLCGVLRGHARICAGLRPSTTIIPILAQGQSVSCASSLFLCGPRRCMLCWIPIQAASGMLRCEEANPCARGSRVSPGSGGEILQKYHGSPDGPACGQSG